MMELTITLKWEGINFIAEPIFFGHCMKIAKIKGPIASFSVVGPDIDAY